MSTSSVLEPQKAKKALIFNAPATRVSLLVVILILSLGFYKVAQAGLFDVFGVAAEAAEEPISFDGSNSQTVQLLSPSETSLSASAPREIALSVLDDALVAKAGPLGTEADSLFHENIEAADISFYVVQKGDTVSSLAEMFDISADTIRWANNLPAKSNSLKVGETLDIPPVSGIIHTVRSGDTLSKIAREYGADISEIGKWNGLEKDSKLSVGDTIVVPNGKMGSSASVAKDTSSSSSSIISKIKTGTVGTLLARVSGPSLPGYYIRPTNGPLTQGIHGRTAVDIGGKIGTPIKASAAGRVIISKSAGWNWGYGNVAVVAHPNGTQTIYAHMSQVNVSVGQQVAQGETVGLLGSTGNSTGPHLHFEVRGAKNPFGK